MANPNTLQASLRAHLSPPPGSRSTLSRFSSLFLAEAKPGARSSLPADWGEQAGAQGDAVERGGRSAVDSGGESSESTGDERRVIEYGVRGSGSNCESSGREGKNHDVDNHSSKPYNHDVTVDAEAAAMNSHVNAILIEVKLPFPFLATKSNFAHYRLAAQVQPLSASAAPLILLSPSHIPDPALVDHSKLLLALRNRLESIATPQEYSIILLSSNVEHVPATSLFVSNYFALQRASRKNLQRLFIVGGGWWIRVRLRRYRTT